jgi:Ca2+-binding EF-hand superfamily protein
VLERIRRWARSERLKPEDAFRVLDRDFDGAISKRDLEGFVREVLKSDKDVTQSRINRLFKLLDVFKRG